MMYRFVLVIFFLSVTQNCCLAKDYHLSDFWFEELPDGKIIATYKYKSEAIDVNIQSKRNSDSRVQLDLVFDKNNKIYKETVFVDPMKICKNEKWTIFPYNLDHPSILGENVKINSFSVHLFSSSICGDVEITGDDISINSSSIKGEEASSITGTDIEIYNSRIAGGHNVEADYISFINLTLTGVSNIDIVGDFTVTQNLDTIEPVLIEGTNNFSADTVRFQYNTKVKDLTIIDGVHEFGNYLTILSGVVIKGYVDIDGAITLGPNVMLNGYEPVGGCSAIHPCRGIIINSFSNISESNLVGHVEIDESTVVNSSVLSTVLPSVIEGSNLNYVAIQGSVWASSWLPDINTELFGNYICGSVTCSYQMKNLRPAK